MEKSGQVGFSGWNFYRKNWKNEKNSLSSLYLFPALRAQAQIIRMLEP